MHIIEFLRPEFWTEAANDGDIVPICRLGLLGPSESSWGAGATCGHWCCLFGCKLSTSCVCSIGQSLLATTASLPFWCPRLLRPLGFSLGGKSYQQPLGLPFWMHIANCLRPEHWTEAATNSHILPICRLGLLRPLWFSFGCRSYQQPLGLPFLMPIVDFVFLQYCTEAAGNNHILRIYRLGLLGPLCFSLGCRSYQRLLGNVVG